MIIKIIIIVALVKSVQAAIAYQKVFGATGLGFCGEYAAMDVPPTGPGREERDAERGAEPASSEIAGTVAHRGLLAMRQAGFDRPAALPLLRGVAQQGIAPVAVQEPSDEDSRTLTRLLAIFAVMLGISVVAGLIDHFHDLLAQESPAYIWPTTHGDRDPRVPGHRPDSGGMGVGRHAAR